MSNSKPFQPWVPDHIRELIEEWGWVKEGRWVANAQPERQQQIAKTLCTISRPKYADGNADVAKTAWGFFDHKHFMQIVNDVEISADNYPDDVVEASQKNAAQNAFRNCLWYADMALNEWAEESVITEKRLENIKKKAEELLGLVHGIEHHIPGWWQTSAAIYKLGQWADSYKHDGKLAKYAPYMSVVKKPDPARWFVTVMLGDNDASHRASLAALTELLFDEPASANIIRKGKL